MSEASTVSEPEASGKGSSAPLLEVRDLVVHHGQLQTQAQGQRARGTHQVVIDAAGERRLVRSRAGHR